MMGQLSPGLFGMRQQDPNAGLSQFAPQYDPASMGVPDPSAQMAMPPAPAQPFVWGGAGERLTGDDIAKREDVARQEMANGMSFAPVQSWAQGAARVAQALVGGLDQRQLDKASAANVTATHDVIAGLLKPGANEQTYTSVIADPTIDNDLRDVAKMKLAAMYKPAPRLEGHAGQLVDEGMTPGTVPFQTRMNAFNTQQEQGTPFVYEQYNPVTKATDKIITTRSAITGAAGAGPTAGPPASAISYLQQNPSMASHFDEKYGAGSSQRYLMGGTIPSGSATFP